MILTKLDSATGLLAPATVTPTSSGTGLPPEDFNMPDIVVVAIKIYAFGGLAFIVGIILTAVSYWFWTVIVRREFADSPPSLELHPERMRAREKARMMRLNMRKEKKKRRNQDLDVEQDNFTPPPVRYEPKNRPRNTSLPVKPALRDPVHDKSKRAGSNDSQDLIKGCGKRVSWASTLTFNESQKGLSYRETGGEKDSTSIPPTASGYGTDIAPIPPAQTALPRVSTSIETRARRGHEMIGATTPDVSMSWAKPEAPGARTSAMCKCYDSIDPLDTHSHYCEVHHVRV